MLFFFAGSQQIYAHGVQRNTGTPELDLHAYEAELQRLSIQIARIKHQPAEISQLRNSLPSDWIVRVDTTKLYVSTESLTTALTDLQAGQRNADSLARDIEFRLATMRESAIEFGNSSGGISLTTARKRLEKVFQRGEFQGLKGPSDLQLLEARIGSWISKQIARLLQRLHISAKTGNFLAWTVIALALLASGYWVFRTISRRLPMTELPAASLAIAPTDSRLWVRDALAAAERGDYREAVHWGYWAAIARLEDLKILVRDHSRTPRESLRLLDSHPNEQVTLRNLTQHFELIWYGYRPASPSDWVGARTQLEKIGCLEASIAATANS